VRRSSLVGLFPQYDFNEVHRVRVPVAPAEALNAAREATPGEMPLVRLLFLLRSVPALLTTGRRLPSAKSVSLLDQMVEFGFVPLASSDDEIVLGFVGQPWKLRGGSMPRLESPADWAAFDEPGYVKAVMNFRVEPADGGSIVETETRIRVTDADSRRSFARYWRLIRPGSGAVRRSWLRAIRRRAGRNSGTES
jgi:hypothetical protein